MQIVSSSVVREGDVARVTFTGEGGEEIAVKSQLAEAEEWDETACLEKACALLIHAANYGSTLNRNEARSHHTPADLRSALESPAVQSYQAEKRARRKRDRNEGEAELNDGLKASFPASDPVSPTTSVTAGEPAPSEPGRAGNV